MFRVKPVALNHDITSNPIQDILRDNQIDSTFIFSGTYKNFKCFYLNKIMFMFSFVD